MGEHVPLLLQVMPLPLINQALGVFYIYFVEERLHVGKERWAAWLDRSPRTHNFSFAALIGITKILIVQLWPVWFVLGAMGRIRQMRTRIMR